MNNNEKVSIVLPTYNGARYLRKSIESCLNQTYRNIELVIVDDGSIDETPQIVSSFDDNRIKFIRHKKNQGLPNALNTGFAHTTGEYLTWTSNDNEYLPSAIEEMLYFLVKNKDFDMVYADYLAIFFETGQKELRIMPDELNLASKNNLGACFLYSRRVYEKVGDYDPKYLLVEDYDYWIRISKLFKPKHYPKTLYIYGEHPKSLKSTRPSAILFLEAILKYENKYTSLSSFKDSFFRYLFTIGSSASIKSFSNFFQRIVKISRISLSLCILCFLLLAYQSVLTILRFSAKYFLAYPIKYLDFLFFFKPKYSGIKKVKGKKSILFIVPYLVPGGAERVILSIAKGIDREVFSLHLMSTDSADNIWRSKFEPYFQNIFIPIKKSEKMQYYDKVLYKYVRYVIKKLDVEIVFITNSRIGYQCIQRLKSEFKDVKIVDLLHAENYPPIPELEQLAPFIDKRVCASNRLRSYLKQRYAQLKINNKYVDRITVIHNGVDTDQYVPNNQAKGRFKSRLAIHSNTKVITFVGRISAEKNPLLFIEIANKIIKKSKTDIKFVMAGDGPEFEKVNSAIKQFGIENEVILTGMIDNVVELLDDTYILLLTSRSEGFPIVILEAMSMGVPVLSTDVGAINEIVENNVNGFLIDAENNSFVDSFVSQILLLLDGKVDYSEISEKARQTVISRFTEKAVGAKYEKIFEELTEVR